MQVLEGRLDVTDVDAFVERLDEIASAHDVTIQAFDGRYVAGWTHLERAVALADRAIARGENVARDRGVEILLYAAGRRQIDRALELGVNEGETDAVVIVDGSDEEAERKARERLESELAFVDRRPTLEDLDEGTLCAFFDITESEREATDATLEDLVCERVALLAVEK